MHPARSIASVSSDSSDSSSQNNDDPIISNKDVLIAQPPKGGDKKVIDSSSDDISRSNSRILQPTSKAAGKFKKNLGTQRRSQKPSNAISSFDSSVNLMQGTWDGYFLQPALRYEPSVSLEKFDCELRHSILRLHLISRDTLDWDYLREFGMILLRLDHRGRPGKGLGNTGLIRTSKTTCNDSLTILYGCNHFVLFGRYEGVRPVPLYEGFRNLHEKFLRIIQPLNVARLKALTISGCTRTENMPLPANEISLLDLTRLHPQLRNLEILTLEVFLLDYVIHRVDGLDIFIREHGYLEHLLMLPQEDKLHPITLLQGRSAIEQDSIAINKSIWTTMILSNALLLKSFWPELQYVYEAGDYEVRRLIISKHPIATDYDLQAQPIPAWEFGEDGSGVSWP